MFPIECVINTSHLGAKLEAPDLPRDADWHAVTLHTGLGLGLVVPRHV